MSPDFEWWKREFGLLCWRPILWVLGFCNIPVLAGAIWCLIFWSDPAGGPKLLRGDGLGGGPPPGLPMAFINMLVAVAEMLLLAATVIALRLRRSKLSPFAVFILLFLPIFGLGAGVVGLMLMFGLL